jgi:hypothetical protein
MSLCRAIVPAEDHVKARAQLILSSKPNSAQVVPFSTATSEDTPEGIQSAAAAEVRAVYDSYSSAEGQRQITGRQLGVVLLKWHAIYKAKGNRCGGGFHALLKQLQISKPTAYRWMRRVNPDFVSADTKCKQPTPTTSKLSTERRDRFFAFLDSVVNILGKMEGEGQAFQFDDDSEQFLATALRLRKHLTHLITTIRANPQERVELVASESPSQPGINPDTIPRLFGAPSYAPDLGAAAANYSPVSGRTGSVLLLSGHKGSPVDANDKCVHL